jgi:hypothetical protein
MSQHFQISLATQNASADIIGVLRRVLDQPVGKLRDKILAGAPIIDEVPHHNLFDEFINLVETLLRDLDGRSVSYVIRIDGRQESRECLGIIFAQWYQIRSDIEEHDDRIAQAKDCA